jgi:hypothetical protein
MLAFEPWGTKPVHRRFLFSAAFAFTLCSTLEAHAGDAPNFSPGPGSQMSIGAGTKTALTVSPETSDVFIELIAADFFESDLRLAQSRQIEAETAKHYLSLDDAERARFRAERKSAWRHMSPGERAALRGAKLPRFANLDEKQKQTFRRIASEELGAASSGGDI